MNNPFRDAYIVMTAMPPTTGHQALIEYARHLVSEKEGSVVKVLVCTQPGEPWIKERVDALRKHFHSGVGDVSVYHYDDVIQQEPNGPDDFQFWDMWATILFDYGFQKGDYIVASESYGNKLAAAVDGVYMPFDPERDIVHAKASRVRSEIGALMAFDTILPEFQPNLIKTVTIFGAESTGKTTLARELGFWNEGHFLFEWARPYLETVKNEITDETMTAIWKGQKALQQFGKTLRNKPFVVQDTDLFSTWGYWNMWSWPTMPPDLGVDAYALKSDLYIITRSNIPFEVDPLRYGGDKRESDDRYWIDIAEMFDLNYIVLDGDERLDRQFQAEEAIDRLFKDGHKLNYRRTGTQYA